MKRNNVIYILLIIVITGVFGYTIYKHFNYEIPDEIIPYNSYTDIIEDDGYVVVGINNYYNEQLAKYNSNKEIVLQGQFIKYDNNLNIVKKVNYNDSDDNGFLARQIIKDDDGYIVTGIIMPHNRVKSVILKLDKDLNVIKKIYLNELDSTFAIQIIKDNDKYIVLTRTYRENGESIIDQYNVIFEIDKDLNIIDKITYKEDYTLNQIFTYDDNYLLIGNKDIDSAIILISKDTKEVLSTRSVNIPNQEEVYLYNNKLYTNQIVYDLITDELVKFNGENLVDNHILLIENDIIYVSHTVLNDYNSNEYIYTYDLNMNKINEYKEKFEHIDKIINYDNRILVIGHETGDGDSIKPIIKNMEK